MFFSTAGQQGAVAQPQRLVQVAVSNPKVTVHRTHTTYITQHPSQKIVLPFTTTFSNRGQIPVTGTPIRLFTQPDATAPSGPGPASPVQWIWNTDSLAYTPSPTPSQYTGVGQTFVSTQPDVRPAALALTASSSPQLQLQHQVQPYQVQVQSQVSASTPDDFAKTLAQKPVVSFVVDAASQSGYFVDDAGQRIDLPSVRLDNSGENKSRSG